MDRLGVLLALGAGLAVAVQGPMITTLMRTLGVWGDSLAFYAVAFSTALISLALLGAGPADGAGGPGSASQLALPSWPAWRSPSIGSE